MKIVDVQLVNVRNIKAANLTLGQINLFVGDNAHGKTTILESLFLLAFTKSHRTNKEKEMIQHGETAAQIQATTESNAYHTVYKVEIGDQKTTSINHDIISKVSDYVGNISLIMFSPDDLQIIKGEPGLRRRFFDMDVGQVNKYYLHELMVYRQLLKRRNDQLKQAIKPTDDYLIVLTERLALYGEQIVEKRKEFIKELNPFIQGVHQVLSQSKETLSIKYLPKYAGQLFQDLMDKVDQDIHQQATSIGPHRDDFEIILDGKDIAKYGSQGQLRSAILSIKIGVAKYIEHIKKEPPILLLDDVFSELDEHRIKGLFDVISTSTQTIMTSTTRDVSVAGKGVTLFYVQDGQIKEGI
jgi:DNA replication and repair protein RecF